LVDEIRLQKYESYKYEYELSYRLPNTTCLDFRRAPSGFESDGNAVSGSFFIQRERRSRFFSVGYTPIVNCNFPWKSFGYKADSLASCVHACKQWWRMISWMIRPPC